jgi:hypothetical protein
LEGGEIDPKTIIRIVIDNEMDESCTSIDIISRPFHPFALSSIHPSSSSRKKKMMEEEEDNHEWRQQQFITVK